MDNNWDEAIIRSSYQQQQQDTYDDDMNNDEIVDLLVYRGKFRTFLRSFRVDETFIYRDQLKENYLQDIYFITIDMDDLQKHDAELTEKLQSRPIQLMEQFEKAAKEVVQPELLPKKELKEMEHIQIQLKNFHKYTKIRELEAKDVSTLVCVRGIIVSTGKVRVRATKLKLLCKECRQPKEITCDAGFGTNRLPRRCDNADCPRTAQDPFQVLPDSSEYMDQQRLKLQESPETVPAGEMPRHLSLSVNHYMTGIVKPGTHVTVVGVFSIFAARESGRNKNAAAAAIRHPYMRVLGIQSDNEATELLRGRFRPEDEEELRNMSETDDLYEKISNSIAPAIWGSSDIKKSIACQMFGGSRKHLPDGMRLRGDINILLLGDPSTAKSQFLKFANQIAPIGVYTSGKGSSAAGLTASVIRDNSTGEFQLEGGALVLADGGLVCIDEFDKMRAQDRVAIHEAMEQQTISIAKAGITTILNSRTAVLAAANPVFGRYDDMKSPTDNIDFQSTILSRFDLIFIVKDIRDSERDRSLAQHIINVHQNRDQAINDSEKVHGEFEIEKLKKYIAYARSRINPRLTDKAAQLLKDRYVQIRSHMKQRVDEGGSQAIPITVRQLEAIVRISESLARMELSQDATEDHVQEAIRLFDVSTVQAATADYGDDGLGTEFLKNVKKAEEHIKRRIPIGAQISTQGVLKELQRTGHSYNALKKALDFMAKRGDVLLKNQQRLVERRR